MKKILILTATFIASISVAAQNLSLFQQTTIPIPDKGSLPAKPVSLDGQWGLDLSPTEGFEKTTYKPSGKYLPIAVPGECVMQGYGIEHDKPFLYQKKIAIPSSYKSHRVILRFEGTYNFAQLYVNGQFVRDHIGGFSLWQSDITDFVKPGSTAEIKLVLTDKVKDISYASGYAHHPIGGILRSVTLFAVPQTYIADQQVETHLDKDFRDATLKIKNHIVSDKAVTVRYTLKDGDKEISLPSSEKTIAATGEITSSFPIREPKKWDAEHPNLYTLTTELTSEGKVLYSVTENIGFRDIKITGNVLKVNGKPVKLRGACRHDMHPTLGRSTNDRLDSLDAVLFKKSNMNYVRTSHYPPTKKFIEWCDKLGIYVECETAICFVNTHRQKNYLGDTTQNDPAFTRHYTDQLEEMVGTFRNNASVLFWSIGNESQWGENFKKSCEWIRAADTMRPMIFSYPGTVPAKENGYDIISMHYPPVNGNLNQWGIQTIDFQAWNKPSVFDEWAHVPCYTYFTLQQDPNIRSFWGISLDMMWSKLFDSPGGLGGAIWGYSDETFMIPTLKTGTPYWNEFAKTAKPADFQGACVGYGHWGIVDVWRREKPEFNETKKAYSPIRLMQTKVSDFSAGEPLYLPVYNRYDHTSLSEITIKYSYNGNAYTASVSATAPHQKGVITIAPQNWQAGDAVKIEFYEKSATGEMSLVDTEIVSIGERPRLSQNGSCAQKITVEQTPSHYVIKGDGFVVPFNKTNGLIEKATVDGTEVITQGPFLNYDVNFNHNTGAEAREVASNYVAQPSEWRLIGMTVSERDGAAVVSVTGSYGGTILKYSAVVKPSGNLVFDYKSTGEPNGWLREAGLKFFIPETFDNLKWSRKGYWSYYPENDMSALSGEINLYGNEASTTAYGKEPKSEWSDDRYDYYYYADKGTDCQKPLTFRAKAMKENIYSYAIGNSKGGVTVVSPNANIACRTNRLPSEQLVLFVNNRWDYPEIAWGDYCKTLDGSPNYGHIELKLQKKE